MEPRGSHQHVRLRGCAGDLWMRVQEPHKLPTPTSKARPDGEHSRTSARCMVKGEAEVRLGWSVGSKPPTWTKLDSSIRVPREHHHGDLTSFPRISGEVQTPRCHLRSTWREEGMDGF